MSKNFEEPSEVYEKARTYPRHPAAHAKGGFHMSYINDTKTNEVVKSVLKQVGTKIVKGEIQNIMTISKPAALCKDLTYLEIIATDQQNLDILKLAALKPYDPVFQMKCVITHTISSLCLSPEILYTKAPIDNLLGETCQMFKEDGSQYYGECISVNPPCVRYQVSTPKKQFQIYGSHKVGASVTPSLNALNGIAYGNKIVDFGDGNKFEIEYSQIQIVGIILGDRIMHQQKSFKIKNKKTSLEAEIKFYYDSSSQVSKVASTIGSFFGVGKKQAPTEKRKQDDFDVIIEKVQEIDGDVMRAVVSKGCGNWLEFIQFDGIVYWKVNQKEQPWSHSEKLLESDCTYRIDRQLISKGMTDRAEQQKLMYEERDKKDQDLRKKYKKSHNLTTKSH
ncbi:oxysterol-binding protein (macronuclear) [Tetrahymena thermophila SB210]|uniref:Oxysterol-binding protein n=1 Tax=Tetrahymena thermophila (strain SB210) TaxID=312017 RepID=Q24I75_TETTS|nr:oxysterol-binding protein [Tetrahymena thermophila SB210]EAS07363.2 oxysterol-binding protein [Tetrahymena thermophila SB210]|eukprot:XP_001027605.2 oxysterol-binding protein [Tetrahymena thermophila SB210]